MTRKQIAVIVFCILYIIGVGVLVAEMNEMYQDLNGYKKQVEVLKQDVKDLETDKRELIEKVEGLDGDKVKLAEKVNWYLTERDQMLISQELGGYAE